MRIVGIDHVQLAMPAGAEAVARGFYSGVLGMAEVSKPAALAARGGCWFETDGAIVHLGVEAGFVAAGRAHPALLVESVDAARSALEAAGSRVVEDETLPGRRRIHAHDPFGNR